MRTVGVVTVGRSDYGIYLPILRKIEADPALRLRLFVAGTHLVEAFGETVTAIEADGFEVAERIPTAVASDTPAGVVRAMAAGLAGFADAFERSAPDLLLVLGDRFEMHSAVAAALPFKIPVAHIHGGELTFGAIDDALRHSITKMSHLHFAATEDSRRRLHQLGEVPWRVTVSGAPSLDNLASLTLLDRAGLAARLGCDLAEHFLLVTFHPVTLEFEDTDRQVAELLGALERWGQGLLFTSPNTDTRGQRVLELIRAFVEETPRAHLVANLGTDAYFSAMALADAMVGNSSSGIIEAASLGLAVVNVGTRQEGRLRGENVIDVGYGADEIVAGIERATSSAFRSEISGLANPYGDGHAAEVIAEVLREANLDDLIVKRFQDL